MAAEVGSILVYIGSNIDNALGENVIKLPFLHTLRAAFPGARIAWAPGLGEPLMLGPLKPLFEGHVDEVVRDLDFPNRLPALLNPRRPLAGRRFDLVIDTQRMPLRSLQCRRIRHRRFISGTWKWALSDGKPPPGQARSAHLVDRLVELAAAAAGRPLEAPYDIPVPARYHEQTAALLPAGPRYVGLAPGAGNQGRGKCWPIENYLAVARDLAAKGSVPVFLLGPAEAAWRSDLLAAVPKALAPELAEPAVTVALGRRLAAAVANCSGTGHMLAAGGCAMVSLFAPTDPRKYAPHTRRRHCLRAQDFGADTIGGIPVTAVTLAVEDLLGESASFPLSMDERR